MPKRRRDDEGGQTAKAEEAEEAMEITDEALKTEIIRLLSSRAAGKTC